MPLSSSPLLSLSNNNKAATLHGVVERTAGSNIALVKYWGKQGRQLPANPSLSFTLRAAHTYTKIRYSPKNEQDNEQLSSTVSLDFSFEGQPNLIFADKIKQFLSGIADIFPFVQQLHFQIESHNSFPHSSGIASSASSMAALALCMCDIAQQIFGVLVRPADFLHQASFLARLGSGSACRSVYAGAAIWGQCDEVAGSSDTVAVSFADCLHPLFRDYRDAILIVSRSEKKVSSRAGHALMDNNPFAEPRYSQARQNLKMLIPALQTGDLDTFITIVENEALTLHALMMTSTPSFLLMRPQTLAIIEHVRQFRADTGTPLCFTLDAGPNVHLLYPAAFAPKVGDFIKQCLINYCEDNYWIADQVSN